MNWCYTLPNLLTFELKTGAATRISTLEGVPAPASPIEPSVGVTDLAFRSDGALFGAFSDYSLYAIQRSSPAVATFTGKMATLWPPTGLAFDAKDMLYVSDSHYLYRLDPSNANVTQLVSLSVPVFPPHVGPMKFDPVTGTLYTFVSSDTVSRTPYLGTIDIPTGMVSLVGPSVLGVGMAIPVPGGAVSIPVLSDEGVVLLVGLLAFSGVRLSRVGAKDLVGRSWR